ncbi:MAG: hypothetical protein HGB12_00030 [Bacteroidetes bacterium]|nr:hypothetical protein [Bacteroidota bacterium]
MKTKTPYALYLIALCLFSTFLSFAQIGGAAINSTGASADNSAMLDVSSKAQGILITRMTTLQRDSIAIKCSCTPATGLQIYNTTTRCFEFYESGVWQTIACGCTSAPSAVTAAPSSTTICTGNTLLLIGNATSATNWSWTGPNGFTSTLQNPVISDITTAGTGIYTLTASNACGSATAVNTTLLTVNPTPAISSGATGSICSGVAQNYTVTSAVTATYTWSRASVTGISNSALSGQTGNIITETLINTTAVAKDVIYLITPNANGCYGDQFTYTVTVNPLPAAAETITGTNSVCVGQNNVSFSIPAITAATSYTWSYSGSGVTISGSANPVTINFSASATSGNLTVKGTNSCGDGTISSNYPITVNPLPVAAATITGTNTVCQGLNNVSYSVPSITDATSYTWAYSGSGATISGSTNPVTINFSVSATSGNLTVKGTNSCGDGTISSNYSVTVNPLPAISVASSATGATPSQITANWAASSNVTSYQLDVSVATNFSTFVGTYNNLNVGNVITYNITGLTSGTTYYYRVRGYNSCGASENSNIGSGTTTNPTLIARDASSSRPSVGPNCTYTTWQHTCSGTNRLLVVWTEGQGHSSATAVKYNGVSLTQIQGDLDGGNVGDESNIWYLVNPASGTNTIEMWGPGSGYWFGGIAESYTGVNQSAPLNVSATGTGSGTTGAGTVTTTVDNCYSVMLATSAPGVFIWLTPGTNSTYVAGGGVMDWAESFDTYDHGPITPAGSFSMNFNVGSGGSFLWIMAAFAPAP